jgi:hypothetical protein
VEKVEIEVLEDVPSGSRRFNVRTDGRLADGLGFDEMLGLVASLTMPERRPCLHWMKTEEEIAARQAKVQSGEGSLVATPTSGLITEINQECTKQLLVDCGFTEKEVQVTEQLAAKLELNVTQVLRHALRLYEARDAGFVDCKWKDEPVGCPSFE